MKIGDGIMFHFKDKIYYLGTLTKKLHPGYKISLEVSVNNGVISEVHGNASVAKSQIFKNGYDKFVMKNAEYFI